MKKEDQKRSFLERLAVSEATTTQETTTEEIDESYDASSEGQSGGSSMVEEFREMEKAITGTSEEGMASPLEADTPPQEGQLTLDVYQTDDTIVIKSTIAGVKAKDIDISITKEVVTIRGVRNNTEKVPEEQYFYQECYWGPFSRSVILPVEVKAEESVASIKDGVLSITLPKVDIDVATKIQVIEE